LIQDYEAFKNSLMTIDHADVAGEANIEKT